MDPEVSNTRMEMKISVHLFKLLFSQRKSRKVLTYDCQTPESGSMRKIWRTGKRLKPRAPVDNRIKCDTTKMTRKLSSSPNSNGN